MTSARRVSTVTEQSDLIDVNSELYFNEKLNFWLNGLAPTDVNTVLAHCFGIPTDSLRSSVTVHPWDQADPTYHRSARFDQRIDFGQDLCVVFELKVGTEASVGQLKKYLVYIGDKKYKLGYVILLSRDELASEKLGYDLLKSEYPNLSFVTWREFETKLRDLVEGDKLKSSKAHTEHFLFLISFLTDIKKRSERLIIQPAPPELDVVAHLSGLTPTPPPKKKGHFLVWQNRDEFWNDLIAAITEHSGLESFSCFRFDFYEYLVRWAFHRKGVYLDIYEDKNYEYVYNYFITNIYPHKEHLPGALISDLYYRFLLIREDEVLSTASHSVFFRRVGKLWYIYVIDRKSTSIAIPYLRCHQLAFI
jgi:hypothetical protein